MPIAVEMPKMTDTMEEGVLVAWLVEEGANVAAGDIIAQVETDKATMDVEAYDDGVLLRRVAAEGDSLPIGALSRSLVKRARAPTKSSASMPRARIALRRKQKRRRRRMRRRHARNPMSAA